MVSYSAKTGDLEQNPGCQSRETRRFGVTCAPESNGNTFLSSRPALQSCRTRIGSSRNTGASNFFFPLSTYYFALYSSLTATGKRDYSYLLSRKLFSSNAFVMNTGLWYNRIDSGISSHSLDSA